MSMTDLSICRCDCHENDFVKHVSACCDTCGNCGQHILPFYFEEHKRTCEKKVTLDELFPPNFPRPDITYAKGFKQGRKEEAESWLPILKQLEEAVEFTFADFKDDKESWEQVVEGCDKIDAALEKAKDKLAVEK